MRRLLGYAFVFASVLCAPPSARGQSAAPVGTPGEAYVGKHTALGALVGAAVREAVSRGVDEWLAELRR